MTQISGVEYTEKQLLDRYESCIKTVYSELSSNSPNDNALSQAFYFLERAHARFDHAYLSDEAVCKLTAALFIAIKKGNTAQAKKLINYGAEIDWQHPFDKLDDDTVLHKAARLGNGELVKYLCANGANNTIKAGFFSKKTAAEVASASLKSDPEIMLLLGVDPKNPLQKTEAAPSKGPIFNKTAEVKNAPAATQKTESLGSTIMSSILSLI